MFHKPKNDTVQSESNKSVQTPKPTEPQAGNAQVVPTSSVNNENKGNNTMNTTPTNTPASSDNQGNQNKATDQQATTAAAGNGQQRVDIPGNNFQRPNAAAQPASRPAYPGASYPGATNNAAGYSPSTANSDDSRRLTIGKGITLSGEIESCEHLVVAGTVEATLKGASVLEISESGSFFGTVEIDEANIAGNFEGDITVRGRLTIQSSGVITGSISYKELAMEVGATLDGSVSPLGADGKAVAKKTAPSKSKKASVDSSAELPFSGGKASAA